MMRILSVALLALGLLTAPVVAQEQVLNDPALEARAQDLAREIRCVVCENEPVALSQAEIAIDMRQAIRERVAAGDTDEEVRQFFADRYGEFVLLRPRFRAETLALWLTPLVLLLIAGGAIWARSRGNVATALEADSDAAGVVAAKAALDRHREQA